MNQQQFCDRIYPLYQAGNYDGFIEEYDRCIDQLGGLQVCETNLHIIAHGHRVLRWSALEQISDQQTLLQDMQLFLNAQVDSEYVVQLICGLIEDQSMERLLPLLEAASPKPVRAFKSMLCRIAWQDGSLTNYAASLEAFDRIPAAVNEKDIRVLIKGMELRFNEEHVVSFHLRELPDNNQYINIVAERDDKVFVIELPLPENNSICEEGAVTIRDEDNVSSYTLNRGTCTRYFTLSPYGYSYRDEDIFIQINNLKLWL